MLLARRASHREGWMGGLYTSFAVGTVGRETYPDAVLRLCRITMLALVCFAWLPMHAVASPTLTVSTSPVLPRTTIEDGLWIAFEWNACEGSTCLTAEDVDLARTLSSLTIVVQQEGAEPVVLRAGTIGQRLDLGSLILFVQPGGLGIGDRMPRVGVVEQKAILPWIGPTLALRPGAARVMLRGQLVTLRAKPLPFHSPWTSFDVRETGPGRLPIKSLKKSVDREVQKLWGVPGAAPPQVQDQGFVRQAENGDREFAVVSQVSAREDWEWEACRVFVEPSGRVRRTERTTHFACVAQGSQVLTEKGAVPIEQVAIGDVVLTASLRGGAPLTTRVEGVTSHVVNEIWIVNERYRLTREHPIAAWGRWMRVEELRVGDPLMTFDGVETVTSIAQANEVVRVFDLSVGEPHAYFAGGLLVHNKSVGRGRHYVYDRGVPTPKQVTAALRALTGRVRDCAPPNTVEVTVRFSGRRLDALSMPGVPLADVWAAEACLGRVLAPVMEMVPAQRPEQRTFRFDLKAPSRSGEASTLTPVAIKQWVEQQYTALTECFGNLQLSTASTKLTLIFVASDDVRVSIDELRDEDGIPVDRRTKPERDRFIACMREVLHPATWPGFPADRHMRLRAQIRIRPGAVEWSELSRTMGDEYTY